VTLGPVGGLDDEALVAEAVDGAVERARTHANGAVAQLGDPLHQRVAVLLSGEQGEQEVERSSRDGLPGHRHTHIVIYRKLIVKKVRGPGGTGAGCGYHHLGSHGGALSAAGRSAVS
jgi:hypothetical protein